MKPLPINRKNIFIAIIGIFLLSTMLYWQTAFFDFVWDDNQAIIRNQKIRSIELAVSTFYKKAEQTTAKSEILNNQGFDAAAAPVLRSETKFKNLDLTSKNWRPLRTIAHAIVYRYFKLEPFWYHLLNIIGHGVVALVLLMLLLQLTRDMLAATVGTLIFVVHPVNSEVVCWAKSFEDLLATTLLLITFNLVLLLKPKLDRHNVVLIVLAILSFGLALTAKLSTLFFPLFLILFFIYNRFKVSGSSIKAAINIGRWPLIVSMLLALEAISAVATRSLVLGHTAQSAYITGNCWTTWLSMPRIFLRYLWLQVLPYPLFADYHSYPFAQTISDPVAWFYAVAFIVVWSYLSWLLYKYKIVGPWLWFWTALIPFANIIAMNQLGAERFLYIPTIASAWLVAELFKRYTTAGKTPQQYEHRLRRATSVLIIVIIIFGVMTMQRSQVWSSLVTLNARTTEQFPGSYRPRFNLAVAYINLKQPDKAFAYIQALVKQYPTMKTWTLYAQTLCMMGNYREGTKILYKQQNNVILNRVGIDAAQKGKLDEAARCFILALKIAPDNPRYKKNLDLLQRQRQYMHKK